MGIKGWVWQVIRGAPGVKLSIFQIVLTLSGKNRPGGEPPPGYLIRRDFEGGSLGLPWRGIAGDP
jgi:hypothetical protein